MKRRIRKKRHLGEFEQTGNVIELKTGGDLETGEAVMAKFEQVIDAAGLTATGGGMGRIIIPRKQGNKHIPTLASNIALSVVMGELPDDEMMFCVYRKGATAVPQEALDAIREAFAPAEYELKIGKNVNLWHKY